MFSRLLHVLVLGLLMYRPRPTAPTSGPPVAPPGVDDDDHFPPIGSPDGPIEIDIDPIPVGTIRPDHPPTAPPGHTGPWPPVADGPGGTPPPPTGPPGFEGTWPPREITRPGLIPTRPSLGDRIRELMQAVRDLKVDPRMVQMRMDVQQGQAADGADTLPDGAVR
ncbi:MAG: hypothetical protein JWM86_603 [Thermoleophilia bacterium]|nr:hypothetical protein [Thermoleophilia bacterium]